MDFILRLRVIRTNRPTQEQKRIDPTLHDHCQSLQGKRNVKPLLLTISETPAYYDANPYILTGYRPESGSFWLSVSSWSYLHNESCNIYSHLIPGVLLLLGQATLYQHVQSGSRQLATFDWAILSLHLLTAACCLLVSAFYHTLSNHSPDAAHRWLQLDYVGILNLILGNFISGLHFGFYCEPTIKYFYWGLVSGQSPSMNIIYYFILID